MSDLLGIYGGLEVVPLEQLSGTGTAILRGRRLSVPPAFAELARTATLDELVALVESLKVIRLPDEDYSFSPSPLAAQLVRNAVGVSAMLEAVAQLEKP